MIERLIVPFEVRSIVVTVGWVGIEARGGPSSISIFHNGAWQRMWISWNCIGWQSAVLLFITLLTGLQGGYTRMSKVEAIIVGVLGTFLMNIFRISSVVIIFSSLGQLPALIAHDYFANIAIIIWLFFFWWLVYTYILVPGESK
jgi:exosortase/archaeosortase family protein